MFHFLFFQSVNSSYEITEIIGVLLIVKKILIISATNDKNLDLANELIEIVSNMKISTELVSLQDLDLPLFDFDRIVENNVVETLIDRISKSSGLIFCSPEYNGGVPPVLSNAITWISVKSKNWRDAFNGKFALIATYSGGSGNRFLTAFRSQLEYMGTNVLARTISVSKNNPLDKLSVKKIIKSFIDII